MSNESKSSHLAYQLSTPSQPPPQAGEESSGRRYDSLPVYGEGWGGVGHHFYPTLVGLLLGLMQTGLFFQLSFTLSSSYGTFLLVTLSWLVGGVIGAYRLTGTKHSSNRFLMLALAAYLLCGLLLQLAPFNTTLWPLYGGLVMLSGLYPGVFFARMSAVYRARDVLLRENNGFIFGLVIGTLLFMLMGRIVLWMLPLGLAALVIWMGERI